MDRPSNPLSRLSRSVERDLRAERALRRAGVAASIGAFIIPGLAITGSILRLQRGGSLPETWLLAALVVGAVLSLCASRLHAEALRLSVRHRYATDGPRERRR